MPATAARQGLFRKYSIGQIPPSIPVDVSQERTESHDARIDVA